MTLPRARARLTPRRRSSRRAGWSSARPTAASSSITGSPCWSPGWGTSTAATGSSRRFPSTPRKRSLLRHPHPRGERGRRDGPAEGGCEGAEGAPLRRGDLAAPGAVLAASRKPTCGTRSRRRSAPSRTRDPRVDRRPGLRLPGGAVDVPRSSRGPATRSTVPAGVGRPAPLRGEGRRAPRKSRRSRRRRTPSPAVPRGCWSAARRTRRRARRRWLWPSWKRWSAAIRRAAAAAARELLKALAP